MHPEPLSYLLSHTPRRARSELSIFSQDWWLELAREHPDFRELKVVRGGRVIGRLPFVVSRNRIGLARGHDPYWSHLGGPTLDSTLTRFEQTNTIRSLLAVHAANAIHTAVQVNYASASRGTVKPIDVLGHQHLGTSRLLQSCQGPMGAVRQCSPEPPPADEAASPVAAPRVYVRHERLKHHRLGALPVAVRIAIVGDSGVGAATGAGEQKQPRVPLDELTERIRKDS